MGKIFRSAWTEANLISSATVSVVAGQIIRLGEYKVEAGEVIALGYGEQTGQNTAVGRLFMDLRDNAAAPGVVLNGLVRLSIYSPQNKPLTTLAEFRSETVSSGASDRSLQTPFSEMIEWASEDKRLVLEFISDTTATLSQANSDILMDITIEEV
jgi:hypothetical protein